MEDTFRVRVDKAFGSLESSSSTTASASASLSSLWSLTDEEIERIEWDRQRDSPEDTEPKPKPYPSKFDGFAAKLQNLAPPGESVCIPQELEADLNDLSDGAESDEEDEESDEDDGKGKKSLQLTKPDDHDDEEWDIRSSIGLDCTLDYEEEEDEFDKTAVGSEDAGDRMYMKDITGNKADDISFYDELPETFDDATRDPRANHMAAKLRLKEDEETAGKFDSLQVSDTENNTMEEGINLKSILKRKEKQVDPNKEKRVRFDPESYDDEEEGSERAKKTATQNSLPSEASFQAAVPDYIRNPSKYKHYTFDSLSDLDEESNRKACMDFLNQLMKPKGSEQRDDDSPVDLQKPITFTPRRKLNGALMLKNGNEVDSRKDLIPKKGGTMSIAAEEFQGSGICDMEVDELVAETETKTSSSQKRGRQYRMKADVDLEELRTV